MFSVWLQNSCPLLSNHIDSYPFKSSPTVALQVLISHRLVPRLNIATFSAQILSLRMISSSFLVPMLCYIHHFRFLLCAATVSIVGVHADALLRCFLMDRNRAPWNHYLSSSMLTPHVSLRSGMCLFSFRAWTSIDSEFVILTKYLLRHYAFILERTNG